MKNKVLVKIIFPELEKQYDVFIPVNEQVWKINKLITKAIFDASNIPYDIKRDDYVFFNKSTGKIYDNNDIILNTDIRNGTELILLAVSQTL
jgi:hypothetical protein